MVNDHVRTGHREAALWGLDGAAVLVGHGPVTAVRGKEPAVAGAAVTALLLLRLLGRAGLSLSGPTGLLLGSLDGLLHILLDVDVHRCSVTPFGSLCSLLRGTQSTGVVGVVSRAASRGHEKIPSRVSERGEGRTALLVVAARPLVGGGLGRDGLEGVAGDRGDKPLLDEAIEDRRDRHGTLVAADDLPDGPGGHRTNLPRGPNLGTKCHVLHVGLLGASVPGLSGRLR